MSSKIIKVDFAIINLDFVIINLDFVVDGHNRLLLSHLNKAILCLQNIKTKNLEQNQDNLKNFLVKEYEYSPDLAENLIDEALQANIIKSIMVKFHTELSRQILLMTLLYWCLIRKLITRKMKELMLIQSSGRKYNQHNREAREKCICIYRKEIQLPYKVY